MKHPALCLVAMTLCVLSARTSQAQGFGGQVSFGSSSDIGIGARAEFDLSRKIAPSEPLVQVFLITQFDWYFKDCATGSDCSYWELNPSIAVPVKGTNLNPYVGGGLNIVRGSARQARQAHRTLTSGSIFSAV